LKNLIILILILTFSSCQKREEIPAELIYSFEYINANWDKKEIEIFKNITENDTTPRNYHFGIGMHLRNNLLRHNAKSDSIVKFFNNLEIEHYDYMSGIILTSYHRYINKTDIKLKEQVNGIIQSLKPTVDCRNERKRKARVLYTKFVINDTLHIQMPVSNSFNQNSVVSYGCPSDSWEFNISKDLAIDGILTKKYIRKDSFSDSPKRIHEDYHFKLKILKMNNPETHYFSRKIVTGDEIDFSLEYSFNVE
jgi:hypothetical protein